MRTRINDKRVKRLYSLGLIEAVPDNQLRGVRTLHAPIYYRITLGGIFNLFFKSKDLMFRIDKGKVVEYYGDNIIFNAFVYPYFERSTLIGIKGSFLPEVMFSHISKCCELIDEAIEGLAKGDGSEVALIPLFNWNEIPGEHNIETVRILATEFGIDLSEDSEIEKYHANKIRISDMNHSVNIQINYKKHSATLTHNKGTFHELAMEELGDKLIVNKVGTFRKDIALPSIGYRIRHSFLNLASAIIMGVRMGGSEGDFIEARVTVDKEDFKLLSRDPKVMTLLKETHKLFEERYESFT